jgi:hypothetical protein
MFAPRIAGLACSQAVAASFVTVTKSEPKNTPVTPATAKIRCASGDFAAASALWKSAVPTSSTVWPGRNFSVAGFGVVSVWMNIGASLAWGTYAAPERINQVLRPDRPAGKSAQAVR